MLFNSYSFILVFLPLSLCGFYLLARLGRRPAALWLVAMSLVFYAWWNVSFVLLLAVSIGFNYLLSGAIVRNEGRDSRQTALLAFGIAANLAALVYYKYLAALVHFAHGLGVVGVDMSGIVLPLGISFFTFTQIGYLVDVRQGVARDRGWLNYLLFVTFFPHLIAGPILHNREMMPQFEEAGTYRFDSGRFATGLSMFVMGLGKKCLLADPLSATVGTGFDTAASAPMLSAWNTALSYSFQLYFDFSGYSDMAIGLAQMFNVRFPLNFNSPYKAASIIEFWQRWHMTLTRYLTMYVYNPIALAIGRWRAGRGLGIGRAAQATPGGFAAMVAFPLFATMGLAGVWHGAGSQFVLFGLLHAGFLTVNHAWRVLRPAHARSRTRVGVFGAVALTYLCVLVAEVFFRAASIADGFHLLAGMVGLHGVDVLPVPPAAIGALAHLPADWTGWLERGRLVVVSPIDLMVVATQALWLGCLAVVVWGLPNTQQIMGRFAPALGRVEPHGTAWLRWQPTAGWAVAMGVVATIAVLAVSGTTEFLYFQF